MAAFSLRAESRVRSGGNRGAETFVLAARCATVFSVPLWCALARRGDCHDRSRLWPLLQYLGRVRRRTRSGSSSGTQGRLESIRPAVGPELVSIRVFTPTRGDRK